MKYKSKEIALKNRKSNMSNNRFTVSFLMFFLVLGVASGCASRIQKVTLHDTDIAVPYEVIGELEVKIKPSLYQLPSLMKSRAEVLKKKLDDKLVKKARGNYLAHAVIKVKYWPDLEQSSYPDGYVYAKGLMVRYEKFPSQGRTDTIPKSLTSEEQSVAEVTIDQ